MTDKTSKLLICLLVFCGSNALAQPVKQWQDRNGEWHFGDPRAAPARGSSDVKIQQPINVVKNENPLPRYTSNSNNTSVGRPNAARSSTTRPQTITTPKRLSKKDCEQLRESLRLNPARQAQHQQRQQQYERECVIGVYYADRQE